MNTTILGFSLSTAHMYLLFGIAIFFIALIGLQFYKKQIEGLDNNDEEDDEEDAEDDVEGLENQDDEEDDDEDDVEGLENQDDDEEDDEEEE
jgi:hypothetical protein